MKTWKWLLVIFIAVIAAFLVGLFVFRGASYAWMPMRPHFGRVPMMGGARTLGMGWMLFRWIIPLLFFGLIVAGIVLIVNAASHPKTTPFMLACTNCGKPVQTEWVNCPYCGHALKKPAAPADQPSEPSQ